jgi:hypothetical protein
MRSNARPTKRATDVTLTGPFRGTKESWQVLAEKGGSRVRLVAEMHAQGLWRLLMPVIDRAARQDLQAEFANLKKVLESTHSA